MESVPQKEYFDRRIDDLKEHFRDIRTEHDKRLIEIAAAAERAVKVAAEQLNKRLDLHNDLLRKMKEQETMFATKEMLDSLKERVGRINSTVDKREGFWGVIVAVVASLGALAVAFLK